jgi:membrane protease YdiL (CAAX protease family)
MSHPASRAALVHALRATPLVLARRLLRLPAATHRRPWVPLPTGVVVGHVTDPHSGVGERTLGSSDRDVVPWVYLLLLIAAEITSVAVDVRPGIVLAAASLLALIHHGSRTHDENTRALLWGLALVPVSRILSLSLPFSRLPILDYYLLTGAPILGATGIASRAIGYSLSDLGLSPRARDVPLALALVPAGLTLGLVDYLILHPAPLSSALTLSASWKPALVLIATAGFGEEVIYRGLLQTGAMRALGRRGIIFVAVLYASMNVGYRSLMHVAFAFVVALAFAAITWKAGSILAVVVGHASLAAGLLLIAPFLPAPESYALVMGFALLTLTVLGVVVAAVVLALAQAGHTLTTILPTRLATAIAPHPSGTTGSGEQRAATPWLLDRSRRRATRALSERARLMRPMSWPELLQLGVRATHHLCWLLARAVDQAVRVSRHVVALPRELGPTGRVGARLRDPRWRNDVLDLIQTPDVWLSVGLVLSRDLQEWARQTLRARLWQPAVALAHATSRAAASSVDQAVLRPGRAKAGTQAVQGQNLVTIASPAIRLTSLSAAELIERGIDSIDAGREDDAYVFFSKAVEVDPENVRAWFWRAKTGRTLDEIIYCLERALALDPGNRMVAANLALFQRRRRKWRQITEI